jgi:acyl-coenzyme A synthetase/AMP-(fatty) acid ligase
LNAHPDVALSAVVGCPRDVDENVVAFVQLNENSDIGPGQIIGFLAERLASYKLPNVVKVVQQLPTLHNGKVDKAEVRRLALKLKGTI